MALVAAISVLAVAVLALPSCLRLEAPSPLSPRSRPRAGRLARRDERGGSFSKPARRRVARARHRRARGCCCLCPRLERQHSRTGWWRRGFASKGCARGCGRSSGPFDPRSCKRRCAHHDADTRRWTPDRRGGSTVSARDRVGLVHGHAGSWRLAATHGRRAAVLLARRWTLGPLRELRDDVLALREGLPGTLRKSALTRS